MKKFKNIILATLSIALVVILSIGGTIAYLQDDDSDVNVMTMGNVKIAQHEYERATNDDGSYKTDTIDGTPSYVLQEFKQNKPLYPIVGDPNGGYDSTEVRLSQLGHNSRGGMSILKPENVQDKFVVVENTGKSDAYVRTIVAFEAGSLAFDKWYNTINYSYHFTWERKYFSEYAQIDGKNYYIVEFLYKGYGDVQHPNGVLTPGDYTYNSLAQVYMYSTATNEDVEAIDGNGNGKFDILVLSQATQTNGFKDAKTALDTAFGETNAANAAKWFSGMSYEKIVNDAQELIDGMPNHAELILGTDITAPYINNYGNEITIIGNDKKMNLGTNADYGFIGRAGSNTTFNNVDIQTVGGGISLVDGAKAEFNGGSLNVAGATTNPRYNFYVVGTGTELTITDGKFSFESNTLKRDYIYVGAGATVYVKGGEFGPACTRADHPGILGAGTVIITGGTFGFDPSNWVAEGYEAVKDDSTWTVIPE